MLIALIADLVAAGEMVTGPADTSGSDRRCRHRRGLAPVLLSTMTPATPVWMIGIYIGLMGVGLGASLQILVGRHKPRARWFRAA